MRTNRFEPAPTYGVFALRSARRDGRTAASNLLLSDDHATPMPLDFYIWVIRNGERVIVVDTGFDEASAARRDRQWIRSPGEALLALGIRPEDVDDVVVTHMHWDHAGNLGLFPKARLHLQEAEMAFCTGRCMCYAPLRFPFDVDHVVSAVRHVFDGRVCFHTGSSEIAPGVSVHLVGGHLGMQVVSVPTARGNVVLASDATHFWANIRGRNPFPVVHDVQRMIEVTCEELADGPDHIVPGHDPEVLRRFAPVAGVADAVHLDRPPHE